MLRHADRRVIWDYAPPRWVRGWARIENGVVSLDTPETYVPGGEEGIVAVDLAEIGNEAGIKRFVRRWGLLRRGPLATELREPLDRFLVTADLFRTLLRVYANATKWAAKDEELDIELLGGTEDIAETITRQIQGVTVELVPGGYPGALRFVLKPPDLLTWAYLQLGAVVARPEDVARCEACDKYFERTDLRQRYCSARCSSRARQRRYQARQGAKGEVHEQG